MSKHEIIIQYIKIGLAIFAIGLFMGYLRYHG